MPCPAVAAARFAIEGWGASAAVVPLRRYVLRRAVATGEQLAETWPSEAKAAGTTQALDVLQALVDGGATEGDGEVRGAGC